MKRNILIFIALILFCSCDDYLDVKPKGVLIPETLKDYELMLNDVGLRFVAQLPKHMDDDLFKHKSYRSEWENAYDWNDYLYKLDENSKDWTNSYKGVYVSNVVINKVGGLSGDENKKKAVIAEAKAQRAWYYLSLVNMYSKHYNKATASTDLGVPVLLKGDIYENYKRESVQYVYDLIVRDLKESIPFLPETQVWNYRVTKAAGYALLARTYLYMGEYEDAKKMAEESLKLKSDIINLNSEPVTQTIYENKEVLLAKQAAGFTSTCTLDFINKVYESNDLRKKEYFDFFSPLESYDIILGFANSNSPTTAEMILIKAEADARAGNKTTEVINSLNMLRQMRMSDYKSLTKDYFTEEVIKSFSPDELAGETGANTNWELAYVMLERRREFVGRGFRFIDIKRMNAEGAWNKTLYRYEKDKDGVQVKRATLEAGGNRWVLPIPRNIVNKYKPGLKQNPR